jgi:hypothetical protein
VLSHGATVATLSWAQAAEASSTVALGRDDEVSSQGNTPSGTDTILESMTATAARPGSAVSAAVAGATNETATRTATLRGIDLHWHDLRHEYASRLVERGVPLAQVRDLLGHAPILTTGPYDNQRLEALQAAVERLEGGKTFDPKIDASDNLSAVAVSTGSAKAEVSRIQVTDRLRDGKVACHPKLAQRQFRERKLVPVRGFEPRSRG